MPSAKEPSYHYHIEWMQRPYDLAFSHWHHVVDLNPHIPSRVNPTKTVQRHASSLFKSDVGRVLGIHPEMYPTVR